MTYHLFVIRGREQRPRSVGRLTLDDNLARIRDERGRPEYIHVLRDWAQDKLTEVDNVRRWWVVRCDTAEAGRELLEKLQEVYRPDLPKISDQVKSNVVLLGR